MSPDGPATLAHRYVAEDGPFGMAWLEALGRTAGVATPVLSACLTLLETTCLRDLRGADGLSARLGVGTPGCTVAGLQARCTAARNADTTGLRALPAR